MEANVTWPDANRWDGPVARQAPDALLGDAENPGNLSGGE